MLRHIVLLTTLALTFLYTSATAAVPEEVAKDFAPLSGYVIMPVNGEYLIDQDANKGVAVGDLFSVVKPGEKIVHPVTKEVLGSLDEVKGTLQVTRVKSGYAYAKPLGEAKGVERGDAIRRYENIPATFWDYAGAGEAFFTELKTALPNLEWQDYAAAQANRPATPAASPGAGLLFILNSGGLEVRDAAFQTLHAYPMTVTAPSRASAVPSPAPVAAAPVMTAPAAPAALEARLQALEQKLKDPAAETTPYHLDEPIRKDQGGAYGAAFPGFTNLGNLAGVTTMADFVRDGDRTLLAATDGSEIQVYAVGDELSPLAKGDTGYVAELLTLCWWRPAPGDTLYLAVTAWSEPRVESALFALQGEKLVTVREHIPYILGAFDRDGDGTAELLLGQGFDRSTFFDSQVSQLFLVQDDLRASDLTFKLPRSFTVQGSLFADVTGDGRPEAIFVRNGKLHIFSGEEELYVSPKQMGGSLSLAMYETNPGARESAPAYAPFDVPPLAVDLDGDGQQELLAVAAERSLMSAPGIGPGVRKSWLAVIKFRDNMFVKGSIGEEMDIPLQGLTVDNGRILFVASEPASILGKGGASHLLSFPLAQ